MLLAAPLHIASVWQCDAEPLLLPHLCWVLSLKPTDGAICDLSKQNQCSFFLLLDLGIPARLIMSAVMIGLLEIKNLLYVINFYFTTDRKQSPTLNTLGTGIGNMLKLQMLCCFLLDWT